jgi:DNA/RNA endonuclease YhcR with UshA esterase domain
LVKGLVVLVPPFCSRRICHLIVRKTAALFAETLAAIVWRERSSFMRKFTNITIVSVLCASLVCLATIAPSQTKVPKYSTSEAKHHEGEYATVKGTVYQVFVSKKGTVFFNIDGVYPNHPFTAVIFRGDVADFPRVNRYQGATVEITGIIKMYQGKPEIILKSPNQIKVIQ